MKQRQTRIPWSRCQKNATLEAWAGLLAFVLAATVLRADTVFLTNGTQINDCKVISETGTSVSLRTSVGNMVVPKSQVHRIVRQKTAYDNYSEQRAQIREGDVNGLFKLAQWCRSASGLRQEADELLDKVISLKEDHTGARRLLGHVKVGDKWIVPKPLSIRLVASAQGKMAKDLRDRLHVFLQSRKDMRLAPERETAEPPNPLDSCTLSVSVNISQRAGGQFFGQATSRPTIGASLGVHAAGPWIGKTALRTALAGEVPATGADMSGLAIQNALSMNGKNLHQLFDRLTELRAQKLEKESQAKKDEKAKETAKEREKKAEGQIGRKS